jgi:hypothetical protein
MTSPRDPLAEAAEALNQLLNGPSLEEVTAQHASVTRLAARLDSPARPIILGQLNVLAVIHRWTEQISDTPQYALNATDAVRELLAAIEAGMRGETI